MQKSSNSRRSSRKRRSSDLDLDFGIDEEFDTPSKRTRRYTSFPTRDLCAKMLQSLMSHRHGWPFLQPVDPVQLNIPDYFDVIKVPMDFGTIQTKLKAGEYDNSDDFIADIRLVFSNCALYNPPASDVLVMSQSLSELFENNVDKLKSKETEIHETDELEEMQGLIENLKGEHQKLMAKLQKLNRSQQRAERSNSNTKSKTKKTKSKAKSKTKSKSKSKPASKATRKAQPAPIALESTIKPRFFTIQEKAKLTEKIGRLTPEDLHKMVAFISPYIAEEQKKSGEVEIDLEKMTAVALLQLDNFVDECLKAYPASDGIARPDDDDDSSSSSSSDSDSSSSGSSDSDSDDNANSGKSNETSP